jgi:hypothetical protein
MRIVLFIMLMSSAIMAQSFGTTVYQFLEHSYSPRDAALGGNLSLYSPETASQLSNPAAISLMDTSQLVASYSSYFLDMQSGYLGYTLAPNAYGHFAFGLIYFDYGSFDNTDEFGQSNGSTFTGNEMAFVASWSRLLEENIYFGLNFKGIYSGLADFSSTGLAFDVALMWTPEFLNEGSLFIAAKNMGRQLTYYNDTKENLPANLEIGISNKPKHLPITLGVRWHHINYRSEELMDRLKRFVASAEFIRPNRFAVRLSYDNDVRENLALENSSGIGGIALGLGIFWNDFRFDYAFGLMNDLGNLHRFGVVWQM